MNKQNCIIIHGCKIHRTVLCGILYIGPSYVVPSRDSSERNILIGMRVKESMSKNPFLNALAATAYITVVASVMWYGPERMASVDGVIIPIAFLSLFVLSAALMGYFFLYQPVRLFFEQKPQEAAKLFLATVAVFACITGVIISAWLFLSTGL